MADSLRKLDTLAEWVVLNTIGNMKNVVVLALEYKGFIDEGTRRLAVKNAVSEHHQLGCCVKEISKGLRHYLVWEPRPDLEFPLVVTDLRKAEQESTVFETLIKILKPRMDRDWDLFHELPGEYHVIRLADDHQLSVLLLHHVAAAAIGAGEIMADIVKHYQTASTGHYLEIVKSAPVTSTVRKKPISKRKSIWRKISQTLRLFWKGPSEAPSIPVGTGSAQDTGQHCIRKVLSCEETKRISVRSQDDVRLIDRLVTAANLTIETWNRLHETPSGQIVTYATVNLKGKYEGLHGENSFGFLIFKTRPEERHNPVGLTCGFSQARRRQFDDNSDLRTFQAIKGTLEFLRILPLGMRRRVADRLQRIYRFSVGITLLGVALPELAQPGATDYTSTLSSGGIELTGIHGLGYKLTTTAPVVFYVYEFRGKLNIIMTALSTLFTWTEAKNFMDLYIETVHAVHD